MPYQWFPGHMTKSMRMMQENIKLIDLIIELSDARIPRSSRNPELKNLANGKAHALILNKADLADEAASREWAAFYESIGLPAVFVDARENKAIKALRPRLMEACREKIERNRRRGINRPIRAMVVGVPNVGKSTFINSFVGRATARTGNKPGVTKGKQWIRLSKDLELLDTPGVLWPRIEDDEIGENLAVTGSIRDEIMDPAELSLILIRKLIQRYPGILCDKYSRELTEAAGSFDGRIDETLRDHEILEHIALSRGCLKSGGEADLDKAAKLLIHDFRSGALGRLTLETPEK